MRLLYLYLWEDTEKLLLIEVKRVFLDIKW